MKKGIEDLTFSALVVGIISLSACSTNLGYFTAASTQNVRNLDYSISDKVKQHVEGKTCIHNVLIFGFGHSDTRVQRAMDDAIATGHDNGLDGDLLVNVRVKQRIWSAVLYGQDCVLVEGDLVVVGKK